MEYKLSNYLVRNVYFMNSYLPNEELNIKIKLICDNEINYYINKVINKVFGDKIENNNESCYPFEFICVDYLKKDGYHLKINSKKAILEYTNTRSIFYAFKTLKEYFLDNQLPIIEIIDEPSFLYRGIIEGYYGIPWSKENRHDLVTFMANTNLNTYMYAPKNDIYHREKWNVLYPDKEFKELITFYQELKEEQIDFYYCISPGYKKDGCKAFDYCCEDDYNILYHKLDQVIDEGITNFGLLLDDIDYSLNDEALKKFARPGLAHSYICNKVHDYLFQKIGTKLHMVMCPTEYVQIGSTIYRDDLKKNMNKEIASFWTGYNCCAEIMTEEDARLTSKAFPGSLFIWDNYPVSDFTYGVRQFTAPIMNRSTELSKYCDAYIINPMCYYHISKIAMNTMADYAWNSQKYDYFKSYNRLIDSFGFQNKSLEIYFEHNYSSVLNYGNDKIKKQWLNDNNQIISYYKSLAKAVKILLKENNDLINELKPWLIRTNNECKLAIHLVNGVSSSVEVKKFLKDIHFSGCILIDELIKKSQLLNEQEYEELIQKRRGRQWYRVWEEKR